MKIKKIGRLGSVFMSITKAMAIAGAALGESLLVMIKKVVNIGGKYCGKF